MDDGFRIFQIERPREDILKCALKNKENILNTFHCWESMVIEVFIILKMELTCYFGSRISFYLIKVKIIVGILLVLNLDLNSLYESN